jgi:hypothetical protein
VLCQALTHKIIRGWSGTEHEARSSSNFANCDAEKWTHQRAETASDSLARNGIGGKPTRILLGCFGARGSDGRMRGGHCARTRVRRLRPPPPHPPRVWSGDTELCTDLCENCARGYPLTFDRRIKCEVIDLETRATIKHVYTQSSPKFIS